MTTDWQPIETAPKEGYADLWVVNRFGQSYRIADCRYVPHLQTWFENDNDPVGDSIIPLTITHWMPVPEPPHDS